jgi:BirA family biotin operon repressor/biotin-[acetyl-CoA-carboxylase] ligase
MNIIKLNAIDSTNSYLKKLSMEKELSDYTIVSAENQTNGRGQMGAIWQSDNGKNLTFSILVKFENFNISNRFYISIAVSLGIISALNSLLNANFKVKWPNDILAEKDKIAGILIENTFRGSFISQSIIGIGLNVNQEKFPSAIKNVTSLINIAGKKMDRDLLLHQLILNIQNHFLLLKENKLKLLKEKYLNELYSFKSEMNFEDNKKTAFKGKIVGVSEDGRLEILVENKTIRKFNLKEIKFVNR